MCMYNAEDIYKKMGHRGMIIKGQRVRTSCNIGLAEQTDQDTLNIHVRVIPK